MQKHDIIEALYQAASELHHGAFCADCLAHRERSETARRMLASAAILGDIARFIKTDAVNIQEGA